MTKKKNDNAFMLIELQNQGVRLAVIASRSAGLKGRKQLPRYEEMDGVPIHRLYSTPLEMFLFPRANLKKVLQVTEQLKPQLIFCSEERNMRLALLVQKYLELPIALLVEDGGRILSGESQTYRTLTRKYMMKILGIPIGPQLWHWLCDKASTLTTCHPRDKRILDKLSRCGKPVFYVPWPTHIPKNLGPLMAKKKHRGVYLGSLSTSKNTQEFESTIPRIFKETPTQEFIVVGPGPQAKNIKKLCDRIGNRLKYVEELPRETALRLIAESYYGYTPVVTGGWGFIGDCWSMKTPVVMTHNDEYVIRNTNALVAENEKDLILNINRLFDDPDLFRRLQQNGFQEHLNRTEKKVSEGLLAVFEKTLYVAQ